MRTLLKIIRENIKHRDQMWFLAKFNQKKTYRGSDAGMVWAFVKPSMYIVMFYFAISLGFKSSKDIPGLICPYFIWLTTGMIAFFYMRDMLLHGAGCFRRYWHLVSGIKYPVETIPTSVALSNLLIHAILMVGSLILAIICGCPPSIYWIQIPFYTFLMVLLSIFWSIGTGFLSILYRDFYNFLQIVNQAIFWLSAILFDVNKLDPSMQKVFLFNPITFICEGYRNAVCRHIWFFEEPKKLCCYLIVMAFIMLLAIAMYKHLRKRIPDYF